MGLSVGLVRRTNSLQRLRWCQISRMGWNIVIKHWSTGAFASPQDGTVSQAPIADSCPGQFLLVS